MSPDEGIKIMEAARDGKLIQINRNGIWQDIPDFVKDLQRMDYRVKPEPREWTVRISDDGTYIESPRYSSSSTENTVKVREVLEP